MVSKGRWIQWWGRNSGRRRTRKIKKSMGKEDEKEMEDVREIAEIHGWS